MCLFGMAVDLDKDGTVDYSEYRRSMTAKS